MESNHSIQKSNLLRALLVLIFMAIPLQWATAQLTLSTTRTNLGTVIKQIQSQSKYQFFYNDKLSATQVEAVNVKDASLEQVLNSLLSGTRQYCIPVRKKCTTNQPTTSWPGTHDYRTSHRY